MFFIMGVSQGQKKLNFDQLIVCGRCGRYGHLEVYMVYSYLSLFFIPVLKWGRRYYVRTTCCNASVELDAELGRKNSERRDNLSAGEYHSRQSGNAPEREKALRFLRI